MTSVLPAVATVAAVVPADMISELIEVVVAARVFAPAPPSMMRTFAAAVLAITPLLVGASA
jgi:hypothetical protein